jgi:cytochrome c-type biogenesis protein CcmH/NrfF
MSALSLPGAREARRAGGLRDFFVGRLGYLLLAAVLVVLLVIGDGTKPTTPAQARIAYLESIIRCPSCADLSIADSETTSAIGLRNDVTKYVHEGLSDQVIEAKVEKEYVGTLLIPTGDAGVVVFLVPALLIVVGAIAFIILFVRRTKRAEVTDALADQLLVDEAQRVRGTAP